MNIDTIYQFVVFQLSRGIYGLIGSGLFFLSWIWQMWVSKKAGKSIVDKNFWLMRIIANVFLIIHTIILGDLILTSMNFVGMMIFIYNYYLTVKVKSDGRATSV